MLAMRCALKIRILHIMVAYIWCSDTTIVANPHNDLPLTNEPTALEQGKVTSALEAAIMPGAVDGPQVEQDALPLVKVAHSNVLDLLHLCLVIDPIQLPTYCPFIQQFGVKINWFELLRNCWSSGQKRYGGGVDLHFCGPIQVSLDVGYLSYQPKDIVYGNALKYRSKGKYGLATLLYLMHPNHLSNAYFGIGYGQSRFDLMALYNDTIPPSYKPFVAGWIKLIGGSELRLVAQLYGGMQFGIAYLLHSKKNDDRRLLNYLIPGYGTIANKVILDITLYLKWTISFLEKKIVI